MKEGQVHAFGAVLKRSYGLEINVASRRRRGKRLRLEYKETRRASDVQKTSVSHKLRKPRLNSAPLVLCSPVARSNLAVWISDKALIVCVRRYDSGALNDNGSYGH